MPSLVKSRTWRRLSRPVVAKAGPGVGGYSYGGGPLWTDAYRSRRAPTPSELVEAYKSLLFFLSKYNQRAVAAAPLRLYVMTRAGEAKPKSHVGARPVNRWKKAWLRSRPYIAKSAAGAEDIEEVTGDHPILEALQRGNPFLDLPSLIALVVASCDIIGQAYWDPSLETVGGLSVPKEVWALPAQYVWPVPEGRTIVPKGYQYFDRFYQPDEVIRFYDPGLRNPYMDGLSAGRAAIEYARLEDEFVTTQDNLLSNGPRPNLLVSPKDSTTSIGTAERNRIRQDFNATAARGRGGGLIITDGAVDVKPISYQPADLGALGINGYNLERVANSLGIPAPFYNKETNLANMEAAKELHASNAVEPRCKMIAATLTRFFRGIDTTGRQGWDRLFFAFDPVVAEDQKAMAEQHKTYVGMGVMSLNDVASELGMDTFDGGDARFVPNTWQTVENAVKPPQPPPVIGPKPGVPNVEPKPGTEGEKSLPFGDGRLTDWSAKDQADRGVDYTGDEPDDSEDNTYDLPEGKPIAAEYRRWLRRIQAEYLAFAAGQAAELLGTNPVIGAPVTLDWPDITDYEDPMASAFTPILSAYWDEAGKVTRERIGLDPDEWRVVDPNTHRMIMEQAHDFCESTLSTTHLAAEDAYAALRQELIAGIVEHGESGPELRRRVQGIFRDATKAKADQIGRTEAARAVNRASLESAKQTGVVSRKKWLLSSAACDFCHEVADRVNGQGGIPLDEAFATGLSDKPAYADCPSAPLHPSCRCSIVYVLTDEYQRIVDANPPITFKPGPMGPEPGITPPARKPGLPEPEREALARTTEQFGVEFSKAPKGYRQVVADVRKVDAELAKDPEFYVGISGSGAGIEGRYEEFTRFMERAAREGIKVDPPRAGVGVNGEPVIDDGRHRWAWFRDRGADALPVSVPAGSAAEFRQNFGVSGGQ